MAWYADTSALVKLVVTEAETADLIAWLHSEHRDLVTCDLTRAELRRAVRDEQSDALRKASILLSGLDVLGLAAATFDRAGLLDPAELRSLDAIHLASALELGDDLEGVLAYDSRLLSAARSNGVHTVSPPYW
ncbi:MAG: type II toxin-antitoxin system VapC family toxin [Solirubrobacteraceae bacterium]